MPITDLVAPEAILPALKVNGKKQALQELAAAGSAQGEIFGFELLWSPDDDEEVLSMDEVIAEWPEIMTC